jgi:hypothetical protein
MAEGEHAKGDEHLERHDEMTVNVLMVKLERES